MPCMKWQIGLTTVPQRQSLLGRTLLSIDDGGFPRPRLFVDGADHTAAEAYRVVYGLEVTARNPGVGAFGNWWLALHELYLRDPHADRYAILQDDLVVVRNLRAYLEAWYPPEGGYLNPFLSQGNEAAHAGGPSGWVRGFVPHHPVVAEQGRWQKGVGALLLVFDNASVQKMLTYPDWVKKVKDADHRHAKARIDGAVVTCFNQLGLWEWTHNPSLVLHTGHESTLDKRHPEIAAREPFVPKVWRANATTFPGEGFDAASLLKK